MRVLQVTREMPGEQAFGMGRAVEQLSAGLKASGVTVHALSAADLPPPALARAQERARRWAGGAQDPGLHGVLEAVSRAWETGAWAARTARERDCTHVHCHDAVVAHGLLAAAGRSRCAVGLTQHGFHAVAHALDRFVVPLAAEVRERLEGLERDVLDRVDWAVFPTARGAQEVAANLGRAVACGVARVIPHARPDWPPLDRGAARAALGWAADEAVLLAVGQWIPLKRLDWVIRAWARSGAPWRLVVLGRGDATPYLNLARELGAEPPTMVFSDQPWLHFAAADAFTSASATEAFGMAHLEALRAGLPIACTAVGGVPEVTGPAALLLDDDEAAYAEGLARLLRSAGLRRELAMQSAARGASWPDTRTVARAHLDVYREALGAGAAREAVDEPF